MDAFPGEQRFVLALPELSSPAQAAAAPSTAQASWNALYCFIFTTRAPQRNNWGSTLCHIKELKGKWIERLDCALEILKFNWNSRSTPRFVEGLSWLDYSTNQFSCVHQERKFLFISTFPAKSCFLPSFSSPNTRGEENERWELIERATAGVTNEYLSIFLSFYSTSVLKLLTEVLP